MILDKLRGSLVALVTPFQRDAPHLIDTQAFLRLIDWHLACGSTGVVVTGTTGESPTLSLSEQYSLWRLAVERAAGRFPIIAGTGSNSTQRTVEMTQHAAEIGVDAALLVTPYYNKPTQAGLLAHYRQVAEAVDLPQILYNVPSRTGCDLALETVAALASHPRIIGLKEASGEVNRVTALRTVCGPDFLLLSGDDATALAFLQAGGDGVISVTANVAPAAMQCLCIDPVQAEHIDQHLRGLHTQLFVEANPIPVKWALQQLLGTSAEMRLPLTPLETVHQDAVDEALKQAGQWLETREWR